MPGKSPNSIFMPSALIFRKLYVSFNEDITLLLNLNVFDINHAVVCIKREQ